MASNRTEFGYRVLTREQALALSFHNLKRLMNKVRAKISWIENSWGHRCCEICHEYIGDDWDKDVGQHLVTHKAYFEILREVSKNHPHKDSPKLRRIRA